MKLRSLEQVLLDVVQQYLQQNQVRKLSFWTATKVLRKEHGWKIIMG
jgi:DNA-binding protein Fis